MRIVPRQELQQELTLHNIFRTGEGIVKQHPELSTSLEDYLSPSRTEKLQKKFTKNINDIFFNNTFNKEIYLYLMLTFQFTAPLLKLDYEQEQKRFVNFLKDTYDLEKPDITIRFFNHKGEELNHKGTYIEEKEAIKIYKNTDLLNTTEPSEKAKWKLHEDGIKAITRWQKHKTPTSLAEMFGRVLAIPAFFGYIDKKLQAIYYQSTPGITYKAQILPEEIPST